MGKSIGQVVVQCWGCVGAWKLGELGKDLLQANSAPCHLAGVARCFGNAFALVSHLQWLLVAEPGAERVILGAAVPRLCPSPSGCAAGGTGISGSSCAPCSVSMQVTHPCFCIPSEVRPKGCEKLLLEQLHFACFVFGKENDLRTTREGSNCGAEPIQECQPQASPAV